MAGKWNAALSTVHSRLTAAEEAVTIDVDTAATDLAHLQAIAEQHHSVLVVPAGTSVVETLRRWASPVVFHLPDDERRYHAWELTASTPTLKFCEALLGMLLATLYLNQVLNGTVTPMFYIAYIIMTALWLVAMWLCWHRRRFSWSTHAIAALNTVNGIFIFVTSMVCSDAHGVSAQCKYLETGMFNTTHIISAFAFMLLHSIILQVPHLLLHMTVLLIVWWVLFLKAFPALFSHAVMVPLSMCMILGVIASQVYSRQVLSRLQFHMVATLSQQLRANREAMDALDQAHKETMHERLKAVRAVTIRDINESILGYICHQIRNPLHALRASIERCRTAWIEGTAIDRDIETIDALERSAVQLAKVADDVWDFQELQRGACQLQPHPASIAHVITSATKPFILDGHVISTQIHQAVPESALIDGARVAQLLSIGLSNAVKHHHGAVPVRLECTLDGPFTVRFEISNVGEGLGTLDIRRAFEPYSVAVDQIGTDANVGTPTVSNSVGLGLPISRLLATMMGGEVGLEDRGKTTVFWCTVRLDQASTVSSTVAWSGTATSPTNTLPGQASSANVSSRLLASPAADLRADKPWVLWTKPQLPSVESQQALHVLVVDDLRTNRVLLSAMLTKQGHMVAQLEDGDQILEYLQHHGPIDMCMLDIHMVRTDGRDVTKLLREQGYNFTCIAVTGNIASSEIQSYRDAGFDGVLGKPFNSAHVAALMGACRPQ